MWQFYCTSIKVLRTKLEGPFYQSKIEVHNQTKKTDVPIWLFTKQHLKFLMHLYNKFDIDIWQMKRTEKKGTLTMALF